MQSYLAELQQDEDSKHYTDDDPGGEQLRKRIRESEELLAKLMIAHPDEDKSEEEV